MTIDSPPVEFLADSSAWIDMLCATGSILDRTLTHALREGQPVAVTGIVVQEVLAGCRGEAHAAEVLRLLTSCRAVEAVYPATYEHAAALYRLCCLRGRQVRGAIDCLIAAVAIEHGITVLAADRDMAALHLACGLSVWPLPKSKAK